MPEYTLTRRWSRGNDVLEQSETVSAEGSHVLDVPIPGASTNKSVVFALDVSELKLLHMQSTRDMTIKTNDSGTPDDTIALKANIPIVWSVGCGHANPFSADVTGLFVTLGAGDADTLVIRTLYDATP